MCRGRCVWSCDCFPVCVCVRMVVDNSSNGLLQKLGRQEFVIPSNVLVLVYGQTVVWTGALFCPLLPLINTLKFVILFYCKKVIRSPRRHDLTLNAGLCFVSLPCLHRCGLPSDHPLPQLPTGAENLSLHHLHLLLPGGAPVWLGPGHCCNGLQRRCVSIFFLAKTKLQKCTLALRRACDVSSQNVEIYMQIRS